MMNTRHILFVILTAIGLAACKKKQLQVPEKPNVELPDSPTISYKELNRKLKASDVNPMNLDVNDDGVIDYSYFLQYAVMSGTVRLYAGVNPVFGSSTTAGEQNDEEFLNMGHLHSFTVTMPIQGTLTWTQEHSTLGIRYEDPNGGNRTYAGQWGNGQPTIMSARLSVNGKTHYGWIRLKFDKVTEELILIDAAWNTIADQAIKAGAK